MKKTFVTSDCHFWHANIITYCNRPFLSVDEMNHKLISNWNSVVNKEDDVYVLGDFALIKENNHEIALKMLSDLTNSLNGHKFLIFGNHDYFLDEEYLNAGFDAVFKGILEININCHWWNMCHYQMTSWNNSFKGTFHLFGHEHWRQQYIPNHLIYENQKWSERKFNVCMDANNFIPIDLNKLVSILDKRSINFKK